ncbi:MAG: hypothetical protein OER95_12005 [Acidimicrobiia bacterium]|nr:hypothetical protein [Acidimicrobiia bacterium]
MADSDARSTARKGEEDELREMLQSLDALDAEHEAGTISDDIYRRLRDDYTVRVADAMRRLDDPGDTAKNSVEEAGPRSRLKGWSPIRNWRLLATVATLVVIAGGAGWLLARYTADRGADDALTGGIDESSSVPVARCHDLAMESAQLLESLQCFDAVLAENPHNVEALTYRAWYLVLASGVEDVVTPEQEADLLATASDYLDQAVLVDPQYPDARAFRAVVADRLGRSDEVCVEIATLRGLQPPEFFIEQTTALAERNNC